MRDRYASRAGRVPVRRARELVERLWRKLAPDMVTEETQEARSRELLVAFAFGRFLSQFRCDDQALDLRRRQPSESFSRSTDGELIRW